MKVYEVQLTTMGVCSCTVVVEAESEEEAERIAIDTVPLEKFELMKMQDGIEVDYTMEIDEK